MKDEPKKSAPMMSAMLDAYREAEGQISGQNPPRRAHKEELLGTLLAKEQARSRQAPVWALASLAIVLLGVAGGVGWMMLGASESVEPQRVVNVASAHDLQSKSSDCKALAAAQGIELPTQCVWDWRGHYTELIAVEEGVVVAKGEGQMKLVKGELKVRVDPKRPRSTPVRIEVSGGVIEVVGTVFTLSQSEEGGSVTLHKGSIRFVREGERPVMNKPGEQWFWGGAGVLTPGQSKPSVFLKPSASNRDLEAQSKEETKRPKVSQKRVRPTPKLTKKQRAALTTKEMLAVRKMRRLGQKSQALKALDSLSKRTTSSATKEVISYEKGDILSEVKSPSRACSHWKKHLRRFAKGRYAEQVKTRIKELQCTR